METQHESKWVIDLSHSELSFKVKHLMISNVKGEFRNFSGEIKGSDLFTAPVELTIEAGSIFTNNDDRDAHLRSADFFDTDTYAQITFRSTSMKKIDEEQFKLHGELTMKGVSKPVVLDVEFGGIGKDPWGNEKAAFEVKAKINRKDWGLNWNAALEAGGVLVSEEVTISADVQWLKQTI